MNCDCYTKAFYPVIKLIEEADSILYFKTPDEDVIRQMFHDIILTLNTKFRCIDDCWNKWDEEE